MKVVLITGGFDPIHSGHISYMKAARELGDTLVVGVNSDEWLTRKKGKPFLPLDERVRIVGAIRHVDHVLTKFNDDDGSAKDAIQRLYSKTMYGVTPQQLKDSTTTEEYALNLKKRHYYGFQVDPAKWGAEVANYAKNLTYRLKSINIQQIVEKAKENKGKLLIFGLGLIAVSSYLYFKKK